MKVLLVGGGGREHAIALKLSRSPLVSKIICAPGNGGIAEVAECVNVRADDVASMVALAKSRGVDLVFVAPDNPLMLGMVDAVEREGIRAFGPRRSAALIEGSKAFAKSLMKKYGIPTAHSEVFDRQEDAEQYIRRMGAPIVVKADGLALGKGVTVAETTEEAVEAVRAMMGGHRFGDAGSRVVVEERLTGPEVSVLCFTDGKTVCPMVSAQDHKRAFDGDKGPNTGGMGAFSPSKVYTPDIAERCRREIFEPTVRAMEREGRPFKGVLYFGLMLTADGPKVIEYNARFGDPETQVVLPRLKTDLMAVVLAILDGRLHEINVEWDDNAAACVVLASSGYPGSYPTGFAISGLAEANAVEGVTVYHAGTRMDAGRFVTAGGRVLGVTAVAGDLDTAVGRAYEAARLIRFQGAFMRMDIGKKPE